MSDQTYQSAFGLSGALARLLEPRVLARGVVHHEVGDHAHPALVRRLDERRELVERPELRRDREEVRDVVAAVPERRGVERQEPDAVDPEPLEVVELLAEAAEVAHAVVGGVEEGARVELVEDGRLEPVRLRLEPVLAHGLPAKRDPAGAGSRGSIPASGATGREALPEGARFRGRNCLAECSRAGHLHHVGLAGAEADVVAAHPSRTPRRSARRRPEPRRPSPRAAGTTQTPSWTANGSRLTTTRTTSSPRARA